MEEEGDSSGMEAWVLDALDAMQPEKEMREHSPPNRLEADHSVRAGYESGGGLNTATNSFDRICTVLNPSSRNGCIITKRSHG